MYTNIITKIYAKKLKYNIIITSICKALLGAQRLHSNHIFSHKKKLSILIAIINLIKKRLKMQFFFCLQVSINLLK